ncbi:M56 family metallopeptidase [Novosphingobium mangrovi (ex Huang et al. 2023)]|uniref:Antirepressor regulating drug resistance protein n=1 Tax=Novosphingobium mangrovi (ex Huang et al. 2023) TaxID=2976432 RepID=A0ABT2I7Y3_9SPHN|nr:M56 family metallopeptidase [Novosphingobium mangrovi (ex Huang et al. 2023)]MCT2400693.1 antirepressor regulating drug resistance protein [Novosphingobium mangrovi (ex Huang et al. 2023)]
MIEWLTDTLVMTGALMALVLLVRRPVGRWFGPGAAYALWALPMLRLVLPPLALPRDLAPLPKVSIKPIMAGATTVEPMATDLAAAASAPVAPLAAAEPGLLAQIPWAGLLLTIWLCGAVAFLAWRTWNYFTMRRELLAEARQVASAQGVRIVESPAAVAPLAFGVFDKVVALPMGFLANTDSENSDFAIAHELEHHGGNDLLAIIAMQPLFALHWFNPLAWAAWRALRGDQEAACDARVMAGRDREVRARYGQLIASYAAGTRLALAAPMAGPLTGDKPIIHRLKALACGDVSPARRVLGRGLFAIAVVSVPVTATVSYAANEVSEGPEASGVPEVPEVPAVPAVPSVDVPQPPEAPMAPQAPLPPRWSEAEPAEPAPPVPPVPPAPEDREWIARQEARHAEIEARAERAAARARSQAAEAERRAAEAERMAAEAMARAPKVEETVTSDGKRKIIRIVRMNKAGKREVTQEMILDSECPADSAHSTARAGQNTSRVATVICTGTPRVAMTATIKALTSAREAIASDHNLKTDVRAEILADLDGEIADAHREMHNGN